MAYNPIESQCQVCGCTDSHGCLEGCYWVDVEETLCSQCVEIKTEAMWCTSTVGTTSSDMNFLNSADIRNANRT